MAFFLLHRDIVLTVTPAEAMPMDMMLTWLIGVQLCIIGFDKLDTVLKLLDGKVSQSGFDATPITKMENKDFGARSEKLAEQIFLRTFGKFTAKLAMQNDDAPCTSAVITRTIYVDYSIEF
ncbi:hypothetical protein T01_2691 [Trichinella spiralis]|uniref:Uncharacterized protein n=1 Tax=Trichinella spiralis TaxID=6334 RepID=A0A0V1C026_TRISP|nr:hypothetical protein T01_2691 [Trichinella spiralis]